MMDEDTGVETNSAVHHAIERLARDASGGIEHLLVRAEDAQSGRAWARLVGAGLVERGGWETSEAKDALNPEVKGAQWWADTEQRVAQQNKRVIVIANRETWERAMTPEDEVCIYRLRQRLGEARRVHLVAVRDPHRARHANTRIQLARERLEMTMSPARAPSD